MASIEIALAMFNSSNPLGIRVGDVVVSRKAIGGVGRKELNQFIWLAIEDDIDDDEINAISRPQFVNPATELIQVNKARFHMPFSELRTEDGMFDSLRALNPNEVYQPFLNLDTKTLQILPVRVKALEGLIIDKTTDMPFGFKRKRGPQG